MASSITFTKLEERHLTLLNEIRNDYCSEFLHDSRKFSLQETKDWFIKYKPDYYIINFNNTPVGYFRVSNINLQNKNLYIGADIHRNYCGIGLGYSAYKKFIPFLFKRYNLNKISLEVLATNNRAINLYHKLNFKQEGIKRQEVLKPEGYVDSIIMSILREEINLEEF